MSHSKIFQISTEPISEGDRIFIGAVIDYHY